MGQTASLPVSPCIGDCEIDARTGWCRGCFRSLDEIAVWGVLDEAQRQRIWSRLARRKEDLPR